MAGWVRNVNEFALNLKKRGRPLSPPPNDALKAPLPSDSSSLTVGPSPGISCIQLGINAWPDLLKLAVRMAKALAPLQTLGRRNVRGFPRPRLLHSSTHRWSAPVPARSQHLSQASMTLWRSIRLRVCGTGGRGGTQLEERTQNNTLCNRSKEF